MQLTPVERAILQQTLPEMGNVATIKIVHQLRMALGFSEEEMKDFGVRLINNGQAIQFEKPDELRDIPIGEKATDLIVKALEDLSKAEKLGLQHLSLWQKFVERSE